MNKHVGPAGIGRTSVDGHVDEVIRSGQWPDILPFAGALLQAATFDDLKRQFRRAITHYGFCGFAYWGAGPSTRFSLCGTSDLAERFGKYTADCSGQMESVFARFGSAQRAWDNNWKIELGRPALECVDSPDQTRPIHRALCQSVTDLDMQSYSDVLIVPTGLGPNDSSPGQHVHLPMQSGIGSADIVAGIALVKIFDCLAKGMLDETVEAGANTNETGTSDGLTSRELAVLRLAAMGKTHSQIAENTGMRRGEVRYCLDRARDRYGFASTIQAVVKAAKDHGFVSGMR